MRPERRDWAYRDGSPPEPHRILARRSACVRAHARTFDGRRRGQERAFRRAPRDRPRSTRPERPRASSSGAAERRRIMPKPASPCRWRYRSGPRSVETRALLPKRSEPEHEEGAHHARAKATPPRTRCLRLTEPADSSRSRRSARSGPHAQAPPRPQPPCSSRAPAQRDGPGKSRWTRR